MAVYFSFVDCTSNPMIGSKVSMTPYDPPYFTGSGNFKQMTYGGTISTLTDNGGIALFGNIIQGLYRVSLGNKNKAVANFPNTIFYVSLPDNNGQLINGSLYITGSY